MSAPTSALAVVDPEVESPVGDNLDIEILKVIPTKFAIVDADSANWLVRKITAARQYATRVKEMCQQEIRRAEREEKTLQFLFGKQLETWARSEINKLNGRRKSLSLPAGALNFRTEAAKLVIDDEAAVMAWARLVLPASIKITESLVKTPINEHFQATGEIPEGTHVEPARESFSIR